MTEASLEQALEELKVTQDTLQAQQQEIEALKTKLLYLTETEIVKTRAELAAKQTTLDNLADTHNSTRKMVNNVGGKVAQIQGEVKETLEQESIKLRESAQQTQQQLKGELEVAQKAIQQTQEKTETLLVGAVVAFAIPDAPEGWLECNGKEISRTEYTRLFERIGVTFGEGDGKTSFNLPDLRGFSIRGWDRDGTYDPVDSRKNFGEGAMRKTRKSSYWHIFSFKDKDKNRSPSSRFEKVRSKNIALLYCIKY